MQPSVETFFYTGGLDKAERRAKLLSDAERLLRASGANWEVDRNIVRAQELRALAEALLAEEQFECAKRAETAV